MHWLHMPCSLSASFGAASLRDLLIQGDKQRLSLVLGEDGGVDETRTATALVCWMRPGNWRFVLAPRLWRRRPPAPQPRGKPLLQLLLLHLVLVLLDAFESCFKLVDDFSSAKKLGVCHTLRSVAPRSLCLRGALVALAAPSTRRELTTDTCRWSRSPHAYTAGPHTWCSRALCKRTCACSSRCSFGFLCIFRDNLSRGVALRP